MQKILVIRLHFPLDSLHVSDYISPSSGATLYKLYIALSICRYMPVPYIWLQTYRHIPAYTKCDVQLIKVAPDDGLIQSETCRASNGKQSLITGILCILLVYIHIVR